MSSISVELQRDPAASSRLYRAIWRWHFYAGLFVAPFLLMLAITGLIMVYGNSVETFLGKKYYVTSGGERASLVDQAKAARDAIPGSTVTMLVVPPVAERASVFVVSANDLAHVVAVDPHGAKVLGTIVKDDTWFYWADKIHGSFFMGTFGDRLIEIAAGLGIVMVLTGLYLWWPRNGGFFAAFVPDLTLQGRALWKELHATLGVWISIILLFFFISGLTWAGVWGEKMIQAWSTFPAEKWDNVPLSDETHASMNHGALKEVPWALEQTKMPESGSDAGASGLPEGMPVTLDTVAAYARSIGFDEQFRINLPADEKGVYTISADSMDADTTDPMGDRTVHIDQYTGKVLADVRFADYSLPGKAMAVGIALHEATMGWWNTLLNTLFCLSVIFVTVSGLVMWWKRRPVGSLGAPRYPRDYRVPRFILGAGIVVAVLFPLTGLAIIAFAIIDFLLPKRLKEVGFQNA
ncbi:MAG: PepSY domain-containing protein [Rhizobiales bacterium]|nr:PepSY domain-containing protein [Hyphomicrobiales bacterium]